MNGRDKSAPGRLRAMCSMALLAPALRLIPGRAAAYSGGACWLSMAAAAPFILLDIWFLSAFMKNRAPGEGMSELLCRALGNAAGSAVSALFSLWFIFYCGFILRSGADRFISTVYPSSAPWVFVGVMLFLGLAAALGAEKTLQSAAAVFLPFMTAALTLVLILAFTTVSAENLLPVTAADAVPVLKGAAPAADVCCAILTDACFLEGGSVKSPRRIRDWSLWLIPQLVLMLALCAVTVGNFGGELTAKMNYPFFAMIRSVRIIKSVERIEALVVALWVAPDFVLVSMLLIIASRTLMKCAGYVSREGGAALDMTHGRFIIWLCALGAGLVSVFIAPDSFALELFSAKIIPGLNIALIFVLLPACFAVGKIRKTI